MVAIVIFSQYETARTNFFELGERSRSMPRGLVMESASTLLETAGLLPLVTRVSPIPINSM